MHTHIDVDRIMRVVGIKNKKGRRISFCSGFLFVVVVVVYSMFVCACVI